jgi:radical SAM family protein
VHPEILSVYRAFYSHSGIVSRAAGAALVGISCPMGPQLVAALMLADLLKEADPGLRVVLGGPTMSLMDPADLETLLDQHPAVDAIVRFDGEKPLLELAQQVLAGRWEPVGVAGVSARAGGRVHHEPPAAGPHVNQLPYPMYSHELLARLVTPTLAITQARGCYWGKCEYCDFVELFDGSPPFRGRHPDGFVDELEHHINEYGADRFTFVTESIPPAFARRMCKLILERGLKIRWTSFAMVDRRFDRSLLELMGQSGCEFLVIGMETTVTRVLKLVNKSADREENLRFLKDAKAAGVKLRVNLIPDLPSTTYAEALESLEDIRALADCVTSLAVFPFEPTRSSDVGRNPGKFGLLPLADGDDTGIFSYALNHLQSVDPAMTPEERADVHRRYDEFRYWLNGGGAHRRAAPASQLPQGPLRIRTEDLDMLDVGGQLVCYNTRTLDRVAVPSQLAPLLRTYLGGPSAEVLAHEAIDPLAQEILPLFLASAGLLAPADETASSELAILV